MEIVFTTTSTFESACSIAKILLERKLVACATVVPGGVSFFYWKDKLNKEQEFILMLKTTFSLTLTTMEAIKNLHEYECPAIWSISANQVNANFLSWIYHNINGV